MEVFLGTVMPFPYTYAPLGWLPCNGQVLQISSNSALYSLIGAYYGGNGTTNFALPNLNGNPGQPSWAVAGQGAGPGLTPRSIGQKLGENNHTLTVGEMAMHNHPLSLFAGAAGTVAAPSAGATLVDPSFTGFMPPNTAPATTLAPQTVVPSGGGQSHQNDQPSLQFMYCICTNGIFPSFNS